MEEDSEPAAAAAAAAAAVNMEEDNKTFQVGDPLNKTRVKKALVDQLALFPEAKGIKVVGPMGCVISTSAVTKGLKGSHSHDLCKPALREVPLGIQGLNKANPLFPMSTCKPAL